MKRLAKQSIIAASVLFCGFSASAGFDSYVIRQDGGSNSPGILVNNDYVSGATEFVISAGGMKAGWGSNDINGATIGDITSVSITRHDDPSRFTDPGPQAAPYFNIWVTDGLGNYAVIANEPTNGAFQPLFTDNGDGSKTYDLSYADLADKVAEVYEAPNAGSNTSWVHTLIGKTELTFSDIAGLEIAPPPASYITNGANAVGSGAPDELGTNNAYGFNWIFGDTLSNYVSGQEGYVVSNPAAVPEPTSLALLGLSGLITTRRRRSS